MSCSICGKIEHDSRCPQYIPKKTSHYCSSCGEEIYVGEEYIKNDNSEYKHLDCIYGVRDLLEWLGYEVKIMEDGNK